MRLLAHCPGQTPGGAFSPPRRPHGCQQGLGDRADKEPCGADLTSLAEDLRSDQSPSGFGLECILLFSFLSSPFLFFFKSWADFSFFFQSDEIESDPGSPILAIRFPEPPLPPDQGGLTSQQPLGLRLASPAPLLPRPPGTADSQESPAPGLGPGSGAAGLEPPFPVLLPLPDLVLIGGRREVRLDRPAAPDLRVESQGGGWESSRGRKWNPLRKNTDSFQGSPEPCGKNL